MGLPPLGFPDRLGFQGSEDVFRNARPIAVAFFLYHHLRNGRIPFQNLQHLPLDVRLCHLAAAGRAALKDLSGPRTHFNP